MKEAVLLLFIVYFYYVESDLTTCQDGWLAYEGNCYLFAQPMVHFIEAEHYCRQHNSHVIEMESSHENLFIKDRLRDVHTRCFWLGLSDEDVESEWIWYTSKGHTNFTDWYPGEPHDGGPAVDAIEDCSVLWPPYDFKWGDITCMHTCAPLCKSRGANREPVDIIGK